MHSLAEEAGETDEEVVETLLRIGRKRNKK